MKKSKRKFDDYDEVQQKALNSLHKIAMAMPALFAELLESEVGVETVGGNIIVDTYEDTTAMVLRIHIAMAIDKEDVPDAKELIDQDRERLDEEDKADGIERVVHDERVIATTLDEELAKLGLWED